MRTQDVELLQREPLSVEHGRPATPAAGGKRAAKLGRCTRIGKRAGNQPQLEHARFCAIAYIDAWPQSLQRRAVIAFGGRPEIPHRIHRRTAAEIDASSVTSMLSAVRSPEVRAVSASPSASRRTPANTRNPFLARRTAEAAPIPVDAPVMTTGLLSWSLL